MLVQGWNGMMCSLACAAYNFMPNEHSKESPFFLMFGRKALLPLNTLFKPAVRYLGNDENLLSLEALKNIYQLVAENLKKTRQRSSHLTHPQPHKIQTEDSVLIKDHTAGPFQPTYKGDYWVVSELYLLRITKWRLCHPLVESLTLYTSRTLNMSSQLILS